MTIGVSATGLTVIVAVAVLPTEARVGSAGDAESKRESGANALAAGVNFKPALAWQM